uniref:ankyrin repeat domain-containing protein 26-like n=1 Tax=Arvicanthis niloticus TaxID=61156 RepID=UPI00148695A5|nr:ankyrin repeat domain-containing protein 26-like [Arvicanthis niloticus]
MAEVDEYRVSKSSQSMSERPPEEQDVGHLPDTAALRRENTRNGGMKAVCKEVTTTEEKRIHDSPKSFQSLVIPQPHPMNEAIICLTGTPGQERENEVDMEMKGSPKEYPPQFKETTSETFSLDNVVHLARTTDERPENITNAEVKDLCKEATLTEERRRHDSPGSVQTLIVCEPFPRQKNGSHLALTTDHRIESEETTGMKAKPDGGVMTPTKEQRRQKSVEKLGTLAISECLPQRSIIDHLAASENMTNSEKEVTVKEMASTEEPRRNNDNEKVPPWIASALPSTREHLGHLADTMHQRRENNTSLEMNEPEEVVRLQEEQRKHDSHEIQSLIVSEHLPQKHDAIGLAVTMDQRRQNKTTTEMSGPCNEETSTEDEGNCNSHESVQSLVISEPLAQEDVVHLLKIADQRGENVANGQMKEKTSFYVTSRDQNRENGSENSQPSLKQKRKTGLSTTMDTVEKLSFGNTAAAHGGGGGDGDNASATSETGNGFIQQMNCGKARDHQFPVEQKKHVGLNKKTSGEKNKALMYVAAMDDQLSESFSEDYDLPDYDNILMIVNQLQMKYKDSGKPLEIQETVRSYKMLIECNQSHSELLIKKSKKKRNQGSKVMKKPRKTEKAKQLKCKKEEQELDLIDVGSPEKQEVQKRNAGGCSEKEKKQLAEEEQQYKREKQQLELHLRAQDTELRHLRNDIIKLQEAQHPETKVEHGDNMAKEHLQKIEHEVFKLVETVKKQTETIEQLERKLPSEDKTLTETGHRTQAGQEFLNTFREMYTTSVMSQLELRIQHLEREFSEIKTRTHENVMVLENYVKVHQSHKLMETEAKLKEVTTQFVMLIQHNTALLNLLSSIIVSECPCMTNFHRRLESLFTQENTVTPTSGPQPSNQSITAHLDTPTNDMDDFNKALTKSVLSAQSELHQKKKKCLESAKEKILSKNCFKPTKTSTVCENGEHSFSEVSNTRQFEKNIPVDEQQHEIVREDQEMFDNIPGNHNALFISPREFKCTNLESEHSKETTHQALCKAEPEHYKDPCLGWVAMTSSSSQGQLRSKDRQDGSMMRRNFNKMEAYTPASNMCMMSSDSGFGSGQLYNSLGYSRNVLQREPLMTSSRPQPFENSLSFLNKVREENQQTSYDKIGNHNASFIKPQKSTLSNLQSKHPEEVIHQASCKAEPRYYEEPYPERIEMTKPLPYDQLQTKDRQDESLRRNFDKMKAYSSKPNLCTTTNPAPGFGSGQLYNSLEHSGSLTQREAMMPSSRPYHFVESLDSYLCRTWQQLHNHC